MTLIQLFYNFNKIIVLMSVEYTFCSVAWIQYGSACRLIISACVPITKLKLGGGICTIVSVNQLILGISDIFYYPNLIEMQVLGKTRFYTAVLNDPMSKCFL